MLRRLHAQCTIEHKKFPGAPSKSLRHLQGYWGRVMDERECLVRAQEAQTIADFSESCARRMQWEGIACSYRELSRLAAILRRLSTANP